MIKTGIEQEGGLTREFYAGVVNADLPNFRRAAANHFRDRYPAITIIPFRNTTPGGLSEEYRSPAGELIEIYRFDYYQDQSTIKVTSGFPYLERTPGLNT
jgi:hypothetical protein